MNKSFGSLVLGCFLISTLASASVFAAQKPATKAKPTRSAETAIAENESAAALETESSEDEAKRFNIGGQLVIAAKPVFGAEFLGHFPISSRFGLGFETGLYTISISDFVPGSSISATMIPVLLSARYQVVPVGSGFSFSISGGLGPAIATVSASSTSGSLGSAAGLGFLADIRPVFGFGQVYLAPKLLIGIGGVAFAGALGAQF